MEPHHLQEIDNRIERFKARLVVAPCDGTVFRVEANVGQGGQYVKEGDELCTIVPDTNDRVVELLLDGIDAPLVLGFAERTGQMPYVRLQFEGWPAVQFSAFPELSIGTFGGKVRQVGPAGGESGGFGGGGPVTRGSSSAGFGNSSGGMVSSSAGVSSPGGSSSIA